jgi:mannose-6-phosphate isomerase-like protein (cupin superfamily)
MSVLRIDDLPFIEFGSDNKRKVRLVVSPWTNPAGGANVVHVTMPPGSISEGHVHPDCDEIIHFDRAGLVVIDGVETRVRKNSVVVAAKGCLHECRNTSGRQTLHLLCFFSPAFQPYGRYPELIEATRVYLEGNPEPVPRKVARRKGGDGR